MDQKPKQYIGLITKKLQLTKSIYHLIIRHEPPGELHFQSGQYATFIVDPQTRRQYSICSDPHQTTNFEIVIDVTPMGPGSKYFLEKNVGERVEYLAPLGNFALSDTPLKKIFVATGTGIAPFRSMLRNGISNCSLYWGLRFEEDVYWDSEFRALAGQYSGFRYFLCLSKPTETWEKEARLRPDVTSGLRRGKGHVTDFVLENEKDPQNCEFYLCGNSAMITEMKNKLSAQNVKNEQIKIDLFY